VSANRPLVEGEDYILEDGKLVFTAKYLLERGHCCNSGCRNCPYRAEPKIERIEIGLPKKK
jgi:hypothetical protein